MRKLPACIIMTFALFYDCLGQSQSGLSQLDEKRNIHINRNQFPGVAPAFNFTAVGTTFFQLQSNRSVYNNVVRYGDKISIAFRRGNLSPSFPDMNVETNFFDGNLWNPQSPSGFPSQTKWPNIGITSTGAEVLHCWIPGGVGIGTFSRPIAGQGSWTLLPTPASTYVAQATWPRMVVGGQSGNSLHCISSLDELSSANGITAAMMYYRSDDGGLTWPVMDMLLPGINATNYVQMIPDAYSIDSKGDIVAIVQGGLYNSLVLWKSTDNGNTWIRTVIDDFPITGYDQNTMTTDINNDGIADTIQSYDGHLEVLIDDQGMVHVWSGRMDVLQTSPGNGLGYFPNTDGLYYWNESFGQMDPVQIASVSDLNGDGVIDVSFGNSYTNSLTSWPTASVDSVGTIYLAYSSVLEGSNNGANLHYRDIFLMYSEDRGLTWSVPTILVGTAFDECIYPSMARDADSLVYLMFHKDSEPGTSSLFIQEAVFVKFSKADINNTWQPPLMLNQTVSGVVYNDLNSNGVLDGSEYPLQNQQVRVMPLNQVYNTGNTGIFSALLPIGNYQLECLPPSGWSQTSVPLIHNFTISSVPVTNLNFGIAPSVISDGVTAALSSSLPRCFSEVAFNLSATNTGTGESDLELYLTHDTSNTVTDFDVSPTAINGNLLRWDFPAVRPFETKQVRLRMALPAGGTVIKDSAFAALFNSGVQSSNDHDVLTQLTVCSFDPNAKQVLPDGNGPQNLTLFGTKLKYTIHFQNTGNDTAFNVVLKDLITTQLDLNSFRFIGSSHNSTWSFIDRQLVVNFDNIMLPDSNVNEPGSRGYFAFEIDHSSGLPQMASVQNNAQIFFDYNTAIITNTTVNTLTSTLGENELMTKEISILIYPNPSHGKFEMEVSGVPNHDYMIRIYDLFGRQVATDEMRKGKTTIDLTHLETGTYFISLINRSGFIESVKKAVIYR